MVMVMETETVMGDGWNGNGNGNNLDQSYDIDVFVINYFPLTEDGLLDVDVTGEEFLEGLSHEQIRQRTEDITNNWVFFIGEATTSSDTWADATTILESQRLIITLLIPLRI